MIQGGHFEKKDLSLVGNSFRFRDPDRLFQYIHGMVKTMVRQVRTQVSESFYGI
jgi:hypothetical protein